MGMLDSLGSLFGKSSHPPLDPSSDAARRLQERRAELEQFVAKVKDRMEIVPASEATYIFVGKPPGAFGVVWLSGGDEHNLKTLVRDRQLSPAMVQTLSDHLRDAYMAHQKAERYETTVASKTITVTPSPVFAADLRRIIHEVAG
jgi:hypothetical protein